MVLRPSVKERLVQLYHRWSLPGAAALAGSPHLTALTLLWLSQNRIGPEGAKALAASPVLAGLTSLNLHQARIGDEGAQALLASPHLARVTWLNVTDNGISPELQKKLRQRFSGATG